MTNTASAEQIRTIANENAIVFRPEDKFQIFIFSFHGWQARLPREPVSLDNDAHRRRRVHSELRSPWHGGICGANLCRPGRVGNLPIGGRQPVGESCAARFTDNKVQSNFKSFKARLIGVCAARIGRRHLGRGRGGRVRPLVWLRGRRCLSSSDRVRRAILPASFCVPDCPRG